MNHSSLPLQRRWVSYLETHFTYMVPNAAFPSSVCALSPGNRCFLVTMCCGEVYYFFYSVLLTCPYDALSNYLVYNRFRLNQVRNFTIAEARAQTRVFCYCSCSGGTGAQTLLVSNPASSLSECICIGELSPIPISTQTCLYQVAQGPKNLSSAGTMAETENLMVAQKYKYR